MPNPDGYNQFSGFGQELPYGQGQVTQALTRAVPLPTAPGVATPRQSQEAATGQRGKPWANGRPQQQPVGPPISSAPTYQAQLAQVWMQLAQLPDAPDLVHEYAARAQGG